VLAIATAIANLAPGRHLMGRTALDRVRVYEWMTWLSGTLHGQGFGGCKSAVGLDADQRRSKLNIHISPGSGICAD
jgi:glutathione S-transferase